MTDITFQISNDLREKLAQAAHHQGMSIDAFVQICLSAVVEKKRDTLFSDTATYCGDTPDDLAEKHDDYLYGDQS